MNIKNWNRRRIIQGMASGLCFSPGLSWATDLDGYLEETPSELFFQNAVLLDSDGNIHKGVGLHLKDGKIASLSKSIQKGEDLKGTWIVPGFSDAGSTLGMYEVGLESSTHDDNESAVEERVIKTLSIFGLGLAGERNRVSLELLVAAAA